MGDGRLGKPDVALIVQSPVDHNWRNHAEEGEIEVGAVLEEMPGEPWQIAVRECRQRRNPQGAGATTADLFGRRGDAL